MTGDVGEMGSPAADKKITITMYAVADE